MTGLPAAIRPTRRRIVQGAGLAGLGLVAGCGRLPWQSSPPSKTYRVGILATASNAPDSLNIQAFHQGLRELGYIAGQNITIEYWQATDAVDASSLATELVRLAPDVILVAGGNPYVRAVRDATSTVPIVMAQAGVDPVAAGLVASLARPGGNVTGFTQISAELAGKRLELLKETMSTGARVGVLGPVDSPDKRLELGELGSAAQLLGLSLLALDVRTPNELTGAFELAAREHANGLVVLQETITNVERTRIAQVAVEGRLPTICESPYFVEAGALMAYGSNLPDLYRRAATHVHKILQGASPADLPVERPTRFAFVVNQKTAHALGITFPPEILLQVTDIVQ